MNPIKNQNYIALDLELNNVKNGQTPKIIEVGVAIGSPMEPEKITTVNWYLDPGEAISPFIANLTGITDDTIKGKALPHETVARELGALIDVYKCYCNPITWGQGDAEELKAEFKERGIDFPYFGRRIFDVKTVYVFKQMTKGCTLSGSLKKAMASYGVKFKGTPHRASVDAENTLRFLFHLLGKDRGLYESLENLKNF